MEHQLNRGEGLSEELIAMITHEKYKDMTAKEISTVMRPGKPLPRATYMSVYVIEAREIRVVGKEGGEWALLGGSTGVACLPPHNSHREVEGAQRRIGVADTIMGDLNSCGGSKKSIINEYIGRGELQDSGVPPARSDSGKEEHAHIWGSHRCRIHGYGIEVRANHGYERKLGSMIMTT